jgi:formate-dependent nitrite reductase membrane component NrfD
LAPLLIADLGDPKRFLNMLRVFKPRSPMNLGAWTLTAYTGVSVLPVLREGLRGDRTSEERSIAANLLDGALIIACDAAGAPLALLLATYSGVLLSATSTPEAAPACFGSRRRAAGRPFPRRAWERGTKKKM